MTVPCGQGPGPREVRQQQNFKAGFAEPPVFTIGMSMWDMDHRTNSRVDLLVESMTAKGFEIVFRTWGDTGVARVWADLMAVGMVSDEDD